MTARRCPSRGWDGSFRANAAGKGLASALEPQDAVEPTGRANARPMISSAKPIVLRRGQVPLVLRRQTKGGRDGQPPAEKQSGSQEAQERQDKSHRRCPEPKGRRMAADPVFPVFRHEEIADRSRAQALRRVVRLLAVEDALERIEVPLRR